MNIPKRKYPCMFSDEEVREAVIAAIKESEEGIGTPHEDLPKKRVAPNDDKHYEMQEELRQSIYKTIDEFHEGKTIPHEQVKRKTL